ncbi:MAG TPA: APC family permease [Thermoanaerobaculia bacterium]|nr:APC family permease [Thermoanaerobaculia bacterium]
MRRSLTVLPLAAATFFMVAGGPYGLEEIVQNAGYRYSIAILLVVPIVWSVPAALMVAELSSALPEEGGYYAWVRRALGPFWGFQEAWLSLAASVFDMAIYPTLFVLYLSHFFPAVRGANREFALGAAMIALCTAWNLLGARSVGDSSVALGVALLAPFAVLGTIAVFHRGGAAPASAPHPVLLGGILIAMWNYMGWDNASTVAGEVDRPQRSYPLAILLAVLLTVASYVLPVAAAARAGIDPSRWTTGSWTEVAAALGGKALAAAVVAGGAICGIGMFNALLLSYSRVPATLAEDGFLPRVFARRHPRTDAPTFSILACAVCWTAALTLGFDRLIELDVLLYGGSLMLEFVALTELRRKEPDLARPFRVAGGVLGTVLLAAGPLALLSIALVRNRDETIGAVPALLFGAGIAAAGPILYRVSRRRGAASTPATGGSRSTDA